jgi:hypothetical protein
VCVCVSVRRSFFFFMNAKRARAAVRRFERRGGGGGGGGRKRLLKKGPWKDFFFFAPSGLFRVFTFFCPRDYLGFFLRFNGSPGALSLSRRAD